MITQDDFTRINNDTNGNPRFVCHFLRFTTIHDAGLDISQQYIEALSRAKKIGGKKFHNKQYGGGIVFGCVYNLQDLCNKINELLSKEATK